MSVVGYPESMKNNNKSDLRIWNNAAFDNGDSEHTNLTKPSWSPLINPSESLDSFSSIENQSPVFVKSPVRAKFSALPLQPLHPNGAISVLARSVTKLVIPEKVPREKIDEVIAEIESEIIRLKSRLELLRLEKDEQDSINQEKLPGKAVGKIGGGLSSTWSLGVAEDDSKNVGKLRGTVARKNEELLLSSSSSVRRNVQRRGFSMGPAEIMAAGRPRQLGKQEVQMTPLTQQNRRKSCFWKLQDIEEKVVTRGSGRNLSRSPKSKRSVCKTLGSRQAVTTVGSKKGLKKEDGVLASIQPKKLFMKDGEKSVPAKKPLKPGRIIASRYNQSTANSAMRKRSLPEDDDKDESKRCEKKRVSLVGKSVGTEGRVKKKWEIPNEIVIAKKLVLEENSPPTVSAIHNVLPKIKAVRLVSETPRDSGPAKKVAELVGRKSFFSEDDEELEPPVCQTLSFAEESEDDED